MSHEEECPHGLIRETCQTCQQGVTPRPGPPTVEWTMRARFEGQCAGCNLPIKVDDLIHKMSDGSYRHGGCQ